MLGTGMVRSLVLYSDCERRRAVDAYFEWGVGLRAAVERLGGWPGTNTLAVWVRLDPRFRSRCGRPRVPAGLRAGAVMAYRGGKSLARHGARVRRERHVGEMLGRGIRLAVCLRRAFARRSHDVT